MGIINRIVQLVLWRGATGSFFVIVGAIVNCGVEVVISLYGLEPHDPGRLRSAIVLTLVAAFAGWVPAYGGARYHLRWVELN